MTTTPTTAVVRRGRELHPKRAQMQQISGAKGFTLPECLEAHQVQAGLDRLLHHSHVLNIRGERYRLKDKRNAGVFTSHQLLAASPEGINDNHPR